MAARKQAEENIDHLHLMAHHASLALVPRKHRDQVDDIVRQAKAKNVTPEKITKFLMAIILGGFTPEAFAQAIAILFGS